MKDILEGMSPRPWHCYSNTIGYSDARQECCGIPDSNGECCGSPNIEWEEVQIASTGSDEDAAFIVHAVNTYEARDQLIAELVEALAQTDKTLNFMADKAYAVGLEGTKDWDDIAGGADLFGASDKARTTLTRAKEVMKG